jgi:hypothetical protein
MRLRCETQRKRIVEVEVKRPAAVFRSHHQHGRLGLATDCVTGSFEVDRLPKPLRGVAGDVDSE